MEKKVFVKELSESEKNDVLNFILEKFSLEDNAQSHEFYNVLVEYIRNLRASVDTFKINVSEIIQLFTKCGYSNEEIIFMLTKEPSLLHSDKNDIFWRILILGKVIDFKTGKSVRNTYMIYNPRILRISQDVMYARIKYLESDEGKQFLKSDCSITLRKIVKSTHSEFESSYHISKQLLLSSYPFDNDAQLDVISWDENKELLDYIYGRSV